MFDIYYCIANHHDLRLVLLAGFVCLASTATTAFLLRHLRSTPAEGRPRWILGAGFATGTGIWATHFVAMLGYDPGIIAGYLPGRTVGSLLVAGLMASAGFFVAFRRDHRSGRALASLLVGGGVAAMHYFGMNAVVFPGRFVFAPAYVAASILFAILPIYPALSLLLRGKGGRSLAGGAGLLTLAILLLHFTGMAAISIMPSRMTGAGGVALAPATMGPLIAIGALLILLVSAGAAKAQAVLAARSRSTTDAAWAAVSRSNLIVEFGLDGTIQWANDAFLALMGYTLEEVRGRHHRMFCDDAQAASSDYAAFWAKLATGRYDAGEYRRLTRDGRPAWLRATYTPVLDPDGKPGRVLEIASDVTDTKLAAADALARLSALDQSQAIVEFAPDGTILAANANFLELVGYAQDEVVGRHHRIFCAPEQVADAGYEALWSRLGRGGFDSGTYKCLGKDGREVWLRATYTPVLDPDGRPVRIVKLASDITESRLRNAELEALTVAMRRSTAMIEIAPDGCILDVNDSLLAALGYSREELVGQHHRLLCTPEEADSPGYAAFWEKLRRGDYDAGVYKRRTRDGRDLWLQATYNPVLDPEGRPIKIVAFSADITDAKLRSADFEARSSAMDRSQAVVEFALDGTVLHANENFLAAVGFSLAEVVGRHHRMFCDPDHARSPAYAEFWRKLGSGAFDAGVYRRVAKDGRDVWLQASYNPILDPEGRPLRIVKFATDITRKATFVLSLPLQSLEEPAVDGGTEEVAISTLLYEPNALARRKLAKALGQFARSVREVGSVDELVAALAAGGIETAFVHASAAADDPGRLTAAATATGARLVILAGSDEAVAIPAAVGQVVILRKPISAEMLGRALTDGVEAEPLAAVA